LVLSTWCKHKVLYFSLCGLYVVEQLWKRWFEDFDAYHGIFLLFYTIYGNARSGDKIIYMTREIITNLHAKVIIWPCSQEGVASYGSENFKWLTFGSCIVRHPMLGNFWCNWKWNKHHAPSKEEIHWTKINFHPCLGHLLWEFQALCWYLLGIANWFYCDLCAHALVKLLNSLFIDTHNSTLMWQL
jgi:hypothetical protein